MLLVRLRELLDVPFLCGLEHFGFGSRCNSCMSAHMGMGMRHNVTGEEEVRV